MSALSKRKNIILFIILFVLAFFVYTFFFKSSGTEALLTKDVPILAQDNVKGKDLLRVLLSLKNIKLDEEIFSSKLFISLQDFTITLPDTGTPGRNNPFAPIGGVEGGSSFGIESGTTTPPKK